MRTRMVGHAGLAPKVWDHEPAASVRPPLSERTTLPSLSRTSTAKSWRGASDVRVMVIRSPLEGVVLLRASEQVTGAGAMVEGTAVVVARGTVVVEPARGAVVAGACC